MLGEGDAGLHYASWRAGDTYGFVRRRMALHWPPSSRPHRMETPQTSRLTGDPCCSLLHPKKRLPFSAPDPRGLPASEDRLRLVQEVVLGWAWERLNTQLRER